MSDAELALGGLLVVLILLGIALCAIVKQDHDDLRDLLDEFSQRNGGRNE